MHSCLNCNAYQRFFLQLKIITMMTEAVDDDNEEDDEEEDEAKEKGKLFYKCIVSLNLSRKQCLNSECRHVLTSRLHDDQLHVAVTRLDRFLRHKNEPKTKGETLEGAPPKKRKSEK